MNVLVKKLKNCNGKIVEGPLLLNPKAHFDNRGFFMESWNQKIFSEIIGIDTYFVQDNHSKSYKGILRGLHYQIPPFTQGKLIRCISGEIFDVGIDLRLGSQTFGSWIGFKLSSHECNQLWIPEGFAHGFLTITEEAEVLYKTTNYWDQNSERSIIWNDPDININWPLCNTKPFLSKKDSQGIFLKNIKEIDLFQ